ERDHGDDTRGSSAVLRARVRQDLPPSAVLQGAARGARPLMTSENRLNRDLAEYSLRLGDDRLVLGHRLSEWCGHAPVLEEELALGNLALDLLDQASLLLEHSAGVGGVGRSADELAFFREVTGFRNLLLGEQPHGDFA